MNRKWALPVIVFGLTTLIVILLVSALSSVGTEPQEQHDVIETISPEQRYLDAVVPQLSIDQEHDRETVLAAGDEGVCGVWTDPAASRPSAIGLLLRTGWDRTEATAIYESAVEFLCPP